MWVTSRIAADQKQKRKYKADDHGLARQQLITLRARDKIPLSCSFNRQNDVHLHVETSLATLLNTYRQEAKLKHRLES